MVPRVLGAKVFYKMGQSLQLIVAPRKRNHVPVGVECWHRLGLQRVEHLERIPWNKDKLVGLGLACDGHVRDTFLHDAQGHL